MGKGQVGDVIFGRKWFGGGADEFKLSRVELSSGSGSESDAYLAAPRPGGNNGIACQRYGAGAHAVSALFAC